MIAISSQSFMFSERRPVFWGKHTPMGMLPTQQAGQRWRSRRLGDNSHACKQKRIQQTQAFLLTSASETARHVTGTTSTPNHEVRDSKSNSRYYWNLLLDISGYAIWNFVRVIRAPMNLGTEQLLLLLKKKKNHHLAPNCRWSVRPSLCPSWPIFIFSTWHTEGDLSQ